jgi:hypothetical protein
MEDRDYALLMRYTLELMRRAEMGELIERLVADAPPDDAPPSRQLLRMLDALDDELRHQDAGTSRRIMGQFAGGRATDRALARPRARPPDPLWHRRSGPLRGRLARARDRGP